MSEKPPYVITEHGRYNLDSNGNYSSGENSISASAADAISQGMAIDAARQGYVENINALHERSAEAENYKSIYGEYPSNYDPVLNKEIIKEETDRLKNYDREVAKIYGLSSSNKGCFTAIAAGVLLGLAFCTGNDHSSGGSNSHRTPAHHAPVAPTDAPPRPYYGPPTAPKVPLPPPVETAPTRPRVTHALTEQFYQAVPGGAAYYEASQASPAGVSYERMIPEGRCIEVIDGQPGSDMARVRIPAPWKESGKLEGFIHKEALVPAPACKMP